MQTTLLIIQIIIAIFLILIILLQKSNSDGVQSVNSSASVMGGIISPAASANLLTKITTILATLFFINCLLLSNIASRKISIVEKINTVKVKEVNKVSKKDLPIAE